MSETSLKGGSKMWWVAVFRAAQNVLERPGVIASLEPARQRAGAIDLRQGSRG